MQSSWQEPAIAQMVFSPATYAALLNKWGVVWMAGQPVNFPWAGAFAITAAAVVGAGLLGTGLIALVARTRTDRAETILAWWHYVGIAALFWGGWEVARLLAGILFGESGLLLVTIFAPFWSALCLAGLLAAGVEIICRLRFSHEKEPAEREMAWQTGWSQGLTQSIAAAAAIYGLVFISMNWALWHNLLIPHGDSAMYEEHLWNLLHGKGFRSYLDQGLFLGEHIQFVHLALLPLYVLWPSHQLLEACESLALAAGAFPVAWMTWRHTASRSAALSAAIAYVLYAPMQFLDVEIDLKTFRPEAFGIPLLLLTLDQLDRGHAKGFLLGVLSCLTVKEDYSLIFGPLGVWIAATPWWQQRQGDSTVLRPIQGRKWLVGGIVLSVFSVVYLWLATRVLMPYFRSGAEIHYTSYFSRLGDSPEAIVRTILFRPGFVAGELLTSSTFLYAAAMLVPVGGLALLSPGRLAVGLPLAGILCLNELARDPRHQFHAPLVPIVFWASAAGLGYWPLLNKWIRERWGWQRREASRVIARAGYWMWSCSLATGLFLSLSPLGFSFWDPGSHWYWGRLYANNGRAAAFQQIAGQIPHSATVASTDFVHPRFTHHRRSYDYSGYRRKVSGYESRVPEDTDFIVIDTTHPYSQYKKPEDIPEYHETVRWELLPSAGQHDFIVLRRRTASPESGQP